MSDLQAHAVTQIKAAMAERATHLDLGGLSLEELPEIIGEVTTLTHLSLRDNQLTTLPETIGKLERLTQLSAANNRLESLPNELGNCVNLTHLNLRNNRLKSLPEDLFLLDHLESLQLAGNQIPLDDVVIGRWNRPQEILAAYREKFPPPAPPPPPTFLDEQLMRYFTAEKILELAATLAVPPDQITAAEHHTLANQFIAYHFRYGLETELRDLLQIWVPHQDWHRAQYQFDPD